MSNSKLLKKIEELLTINNNFFAIACSGGADSMFLTHCLASIFPKSRIFVLIVDHDLQKNSSQVAENVSNFWKIFGLQTKVLVWNHGEILTGIEEKARNARYDLIGDFCKKHNIDTVFLAHHIDDKIETFFLNASRGCSLAGLSSMREIAIKNGIKYLRPMVHIIEKKQIIDFLKTNKIPWFEDETNADTKFKRNKFRAMFQFSSEEKAGIIKTIQNLEEFYDEKMLQMRNFCTQFGLLKNAVLKIEITHFFKVSKTDFRYFTLIVLFEKIYQFVSWELRQEGVERLFEWLNSKSQKMTFAKCIFLKKDGFLWIFPEFQRLESVECFASEKQCWNGLFELVCERNSTIMPLGKLPNDARKSLQIKEKFLEVAHLPVVVCDGKISVPHLGILEFDVKIV